MQVHLVTFCNTGRASFALLSGRGVERTSVAGLEVPDVACGGTVGAIFHQGLCYIAMQAEPATIAIYRDDWTLERIIEVDEVKDIHGIAILGQELLIVSTASNQIIAHHLDTHRVRAFWSDGGSLSDTLHVNDICVSGDRVLASRFGRRDASGQRSGSVFDAVSGEVLVHHLREPHSVTMDAEGLPHILESPTGDVLRCRQGFPPRRLLGIIGYARGLSLGADTIAVGKSGYRQRSRSGIGDSRQAPLSPTEEAAEASAMSGVFLIDRATGSSQFIDTTAVGPEVYAVVESPFALPARRSKQRPGSRGWRTERRRG